MSLLAFGLLGRQRGHLQAWEGREVLKALAGSPSGLQAFLKPGMARLWWLDLEVEFMDGGGKVAKSGEEVLRGPRVFLLGNGL